MASADPWDVIRSVQRWSALALYATSNSPWPVEIVEEQVPDLPRPFAIVSPLSPVRPVSFTSGLEGQPIRYNATLSLTAFPSYEGGARVANAEAYRVLGGIQACVLRGLFLAPVGDDFPVRFAHPTLIPLFDYEGVPVSGPNRAGPDVPYAQMDIDDFGGRVIPDPDDDARFTVVCDIVLSFFGQGAVRAAWEAPPTVAMPPSWGGDPTAEDAP